MVLGIFESTRAVSAQCVLLQCRRMPQYRPNVDAGGRGHRGHHQGCRGPATTVEDRVGVPKLSRTREPYCGLGVFPNFFRLFGMIAGINEVVRVWWTGSKWRTRIVLSI